MRSTEFIKEAGQGGPGRQMTDAEYAAQQAQGEKNLQGIKNFFAGAPQTGGTAVPTARDPAQQAGQGAAAPAAPAVAAPAPAPAAAPAAPAASFTGQSDEFGGMEQPAAAPAAATKLPTRPGQQTSGRQPDPAVLKIQQDLIAKGYKIKADGIMGPATQAAQKAAAGPNQSSAETSRLSRTAPGAVQQAATPATDPTTQSVNQRLAAAFGSGGPRRGYQSGQGAAPVAQAATPVPAADPTKQSVSQRLATGPSLIDQGRARLGIPAGGTSPAAPKAPAAPVTGGATNADRRDFEESVDLMRRMSTMLKG